MMMMTMIMRRTWSPGWRTFVSGMLLAMILLLSLLPDGQGGRGRHPLDVGVDSSGVHRPGVLLFLLFASKMHLKVIITRGKRRNRFLLPGSSAELVRDVKRPS